MSLRVNLNTASLSAHRTLAATDNALSKSIERLSSGYRINGAGDDPAGLVISEKLRAQVSGTAQAIRNAGDAVNMVKTAEGALGEVHRLLRSMRDLAVHAANAGVNDTTILAADQAQITNAIASINKIADETIFGNKKLLDGSAGIKSLVNSAAGVSANLSNTTGLVDGDLIDIVTTQAATKATITSDVDLSAGPTADGAFLLNGISISYADTDTQAGVVTKINAKSDETGVIASVSGNFIKFDQIDYGSSKGVTLTGVANDFHSAAVVSDFGLDVVATVKVAGVDVSDASWTSGTGINLKDSDGNEINLTTATATAAPGAFNDAFQIQEGTLVFQIGAYAGQTREINIASVNANQIGLGAVGSDALSDVSVLTSTDATDALNILDKAISDVSTLRASLGATQKNVFESAISSLTIAKENIQASESSIRDTDMAAEMVEFTKLQILSQAGTAMLMQANQGAQSLLSLLR